MTTTTRLCNVCGAAAHWTLDALDLCPTCHADAVRGQDRTDGWEIIPEATVGLDVAPDRLEVELPDPPDACSRPGCGLPASVHGHGETGREDSHPFEAPAWHGLERPDRGAINPAIADLEGTIPQLDSPAGREAILAGVRRLPDGIRPRGVAPSLGDVLGSTKYPAPRPDPVVPDPDYEALEDIPLGAPIVFDHKARTVRLVSSPCPPPIENPRNPVPVILAGGIHDHGGEGPEVLGLTPSARRLQLLDFAAALERQVGREGGVEGDVPEGVRVVNLSLCFAAQIAQAIRDEILTASPPELRAGYLAREDIPGGSPVVFDRATGTVRISSSPLNPGGIETVQREMAERLAAQGLLESHADVLEVEARRVVDLEPDAPLEEVLAADHPEGWQGRRVMTPTYALSLAADLRTARATLLQVGRVGRRSEGGPR